MNMLEYSRVNTQIAVLKDLLAVYGNRSIDNVIMQLESRIKEADKNGIDVTADVKEVAIGETLEFEGKTLLCKEAPDERCEGCAFLDKIEDCRYNGYCSSEYRNDGKNVCFVNVEDDYECKAVF